MNLIAINNSSISEVLEQVNILIAASGYEERSRAIAEIVGRRIPQRHVISFRELKESLQRKDNDSTFDQSGFKVHEASGNSPNQITELLQSLIPRQVPNCGPLAMDISSMTRVWYGEAVRFLATFNYYNELVAYFIYIPGTEYPTNQPLLPNEIVSPVEGFAAVETPDLPVALILGLGCEPERALGLLELLDPKRIILMIPRFGLIDSLNERVRKNNQSLLSSSSATSVFEYPLHDPTATFRIIDSICCGLQDEYCVVLASLGPKLFGLQCFLQAAHNPRISVWRVSYGTSRPPNNIAPDKSKLIVCKTIWSS